MLLLNPYSVVAFFAILHLIDSIKILRKREATLSNALNIKEWEIKITGRHAITFARLSIVGDLLIIASGTILNPYYNFVSDYFVLFSCTGGLLFWGLATIVTVKYGVRGG